MGTGVLEYEGHGGEGIPLRCVSGGADRRARFR